MPQGKERKGYNGEGNARHGSMRRSKISGDKVLCGGVRVMLAVSWFLKQWVS